MQVRIQQSFFPYGSLRPTIHRSRHPIEKKRDREWRRDCRERESSTQKAFLTGSVYSNNITFSSQASFQTKSTFSPSPSRYTTPQIRLSTEEKETVIDDTVTWIRQRQKMKITAGQSRNWLVRRRSALLYAWYLLFIICNRTMKP